MVTELDVYRPDQWHDYFIMVGGAAAVLTGLVFVAMPLNINLINRPFPAGSFQLC